jgi:intracellular multiplication protein IcmV
MKSIKNRTLKVISSMLNFRAWLDYDRIKASLKYIGGGIKKLFVPQQMKEARDFNEVMKEKGLTEDALKKQKTALLRLSYLMVVIGLGLFCYTVYLLIAGHWLAIFLSMVVTGLAFVLAFRYHFWYFQMKQRNLGCTIEEWYRIGLKGEKK